LETSISATFGEWGKRKDQGEGDYEPPGLTDEELEELLGEGDTSDEDA
jgi:hypothetical protein